MIGIPKPKFFYINTTTSLPLGIYYLSKEKVSLSKTVVFSKPSFLNIVKRDWLIKKDFFIKKIIAEPNDNVCIKNGVLFINGKYVSKIKEYDRNGKKLPKNIQEDFCRNLSKDEFWTSADHENSYDSRYYGPIMAVNLKTVRPLILF